MKPPMTEKYKIRLGKFLDFIGIDVEDENLCLHNSFDRERRIPVKKERGIICNGVVFDR